MSCEQNSPVVGIIMGSESDMPAMEPCMKQLDEFGVPYEVKVASAHRKPAEVHEWASSAHERGIRVIVAAAGTAIAAHAVGSAIHYKQQHMKEEANVSLPAFGDAPGAPDKETEE